MTEIHLTVNGAAQRADVGSLATLAEVIRERLGLTGTKIACSEGTCGACTVIVDGRPTLSCILLARQADGCEVTTIEGLGAPDGLSPLQQAFVDADAFQCGFCTPGQLASATALLARIERPTREEIREAMSGNLCRCGAYPKIELAIARFVDGSR